jgi:hypothetical protein
VDARDELASSDARFHDLNVTRLRRDQLVPVESSVSWHDLLLSELVRRKRRMTSAANQVRAFATGLDE